MLKTNLFKMLTMAFLVLVVGTSSQYAYGSQDIKYPVMKQPAETVEIDSVGVDETLNYGIASKSVYDPRGSKVSAVRDQGIYGTCWIFSSVAAMESNIIKKNFATKNIDLSENQLLYYYFNRKTDKVGYTKGDKNVCVGDYRFVGGIPMSLGIETMTGMGVTAEKNSPYISTPKSNICYKGAYDVDGVYFYDYSLANAKNAISKYGAVVCAMYMDEDYLNTSTAAYYCYNDIGTTNHAVTIVGWDDNYSKENFGTNMNKPASNGAWIVKNSYGTSFGDDGYMYMSYEDKNINSLCSYDMIKSSEKNDNCYQHDGSGGMWYLNIASGDSVSNIYTAKGTKNGGCEVIKSVGICTYTENARYSLQIYTGITDSTEPSSGTQMFSKPQTGKLSEAGYVKIKLKNPVTLASGEKFAIVIKFLDPCRVGIENSYDNYMLKFVANIGKNKSFWKSVFFNKWIDVGQNQDYILRIKAYTDNSSKKAKYKISNKSITLKTGKKYKLCITTSPSGIKRNVIWSSSNKSVASVNKKGNVLGKKRGKAIISAKFSAGSKVKTLKCTVNVK